MKATGTVRVPECEPVLVRITALQYGRSDLYCDRTGQPKQVAVITLTARDLEHDQDDWADLTVTHGFTFERAKRGQPSKLAELVRAAIEPNLTDDQLWDVDIDHLTGSHVVMEGEWALDDIGRRYWRVNRYAPVPVALLVARVGGHHNHSDDSGSEPLDVPSNPQEEAAYRRWRLGLVEAGLSDEAIGAIDRNRFGVKARAAYSDDCEGRASADDLPSLEVVAVARLRAEARAFFRMAS